MILLVATCAKYADVMPYFVQFLDKYWQTKFKKVIINCPLSLAGYEQVQLDQDYGWTANILRYLELSGVKDNLLIVHEDYILLNKLDDKRLMSIDEDVKDKIGYIRLIRYSDNAHGKGQGWKWPSKEPYNDKYNYADREYFYVKRGDWYRTRLPVSHQPAIWNNNFVRSFFQPHWSPWQQEVLGSREFMRDGTIGGKKCDYEFLTLKDDYFMYCNAVRDGKYSKEFISLLKRQKLPTPRKRDITKNYADLNPANRREIDLRQTNGTYPKEKYANQ